MGIRLTSILLAGAMSLGLTSCIHGGRPAFKVEKVKETKEQLEYRLGQQKEQCIEVVKGHNDRNDLDRINVVLVMVNYDADKVMERAERAIDYRQRHKGLLSHEVIASNASTYNFWVVKDPISVEIPDTIGEGENEKENKYARVQVVDPAEKAADVCGFDNKQIVTAVVNKKLISTAHYPSWSELDYHLLDLQNLEVYQEKYSDLTVDDCTKKYFECYSHPALSDKNLCEAISDVSGDQPSTSKVCPIITGQYEFETIVLADTSNYAFAHELYHAETGLSDLYENERKFKEDVTYYGSEEALMGRISHKSMNCMVAESQEVCEAQAPWKQEFPEDTGCFEGCYYTKEVAGMKTFRPEKESTMRSSTNMKLGEWDEYMYCIGHEMYTGHATGVCQDYGFDKAGAEYKRKKRPRKRATREVDVENWL